MQLQHDKHLMQEGHTMQLYTMEQWTRDREFKARPGQEITEDVYNQLRDVVPPKELPPATAKKVWQDLRIAVHAGYLMGEPTSNDADGLLYRAFGMNDYGKGKHYYYLGLSPAAPVLDGDYYYFDCMNAFVNGGLFPAAEFATDEEAIRQAANYEATLIKYHYQQGEQTDSRVIYEPLLQ